MKRLGIVLICLAIPLQLGASAQERTPQLAYDYCGPYDGGSGLEIACDVRLFTGGPFPAWLGWGARPEWSADGLRIAFADFNLAIYNLVDGSITAFFPGAEWVDGPRWSPDSTRIAFTSHRDSQMELYVINADGSALRRLTDSVGFRGAFAWSPDGTAIAFGATVGGVPELFVMQADGSNQTRLTHGVGFRADSPESAPSWSSDGSRIAFECVNDICSVNADGTNVVQLTIDPVRAGNAVYSPVDGRIAFVTGRFGGTEVAILEENGAVTRVAAGLQSWQPAWSPGGESLALVNVVPFDCFVADNSCTPGQFDMVYTVNSDGSALTPVDQGHHPRWAPSLSGQPAADFTSTCSHAACQLDATGSFDPDGSITSYAWDFGDGTTGSGATAAHHFVPGDVYLWPGLYLVRLTVTDNTGAIGILLRYVWANAPPVASFTVTCTGPTCAFDGSASSDPEGNIARYSWVFGDGSYGSTQIPTVTHTYATGTFQPRLNVSDDGGRTATAVATVTIVNALPLAAFTMTCAELTCTFNASGSTDADDGILHYRWDFGNGSSSSLSDTVVTRVYEVGGTYLVTLTVIDRAGQTATSSQTVTVVAPPPPPPPVEMHVGDLDGSATSQQKVWTALATVEIHRGDHQRVNSVTVSGTWSDGTAATCTTDTAGRCVLSRNGIPNKTNSVTLTVTGAARATFTYAPAANHDPDSDSNGTAVTVRKR